jgi:hypothetical protein
MIVSRYVAMAFVSALCIAGCNRPAAPAADHFSLVLEHSAQGWKASCEVGCRWREITMSCAGCEVRLTSVGIGPASSAEDEPGTFAFTLADSGSGWAARSLRGAKWITLSWGCPQATCRARIDEVGVRGS